MLGDDVGEAVSGVNTQVDRIHEGVADPCGGTVFEAVHGFAARVMAGDLIVIVPSGVGNGKFHFIHGRNSTGDVDATVGTQIPIDAEATHDDALEQLAPELHLAHDGLTVVDSEAVLGDEVVPVKAPSVSDLIGLSEKVTFTESKVSVEAVPYVGAEIVVVLEKDGLLPAFGGGFLEGAVVASQTMIAVGFQADVAAHAMDGAGVIEPVIADVQLSAFTKLLVLQEEIVCAGMGFVVP